MLGKVVGIVVDGTLLTTAGYMKAGKFPNMIIVLRDPACVLSGGLVEIPCMKVGLLRTICSIVRGSRLHALDHLAGSVGSVSKTTTASRCLDALREERIETFRSTSVRKFRDTEASICMFASSD